jgi:hypothetical protein
MTYARKLTAEEKQIARAFCEFIYEVPFAKTFTLWNVQGALRMVNSGVPDRQAYTEHLRVAADRKWIEPVRGQADTYRRIRQHPNFTHHRSAGMRSELQALRDRLICVLSGGEWIA